MQIRPYTIQINEYLSRIEYQLFFDDRLYHFETNNYQIPDCYVNKYRSSNNMNQFVYELKLLLVSYYSSELEDLEDKIISYAESIV